MDASGREIALAARRRAAKEFYAAAVRIGNHPWIEFTGLMNEYVNCCQAAHLAGVDFSACNTHTGQALPMQSYQVQYMNEKLECIFPGRSVMAKVAQ